MVAPCLRFRAFSIERRTSVPWIDTTSIFFPSLCDDPTLLGDNARKLAWFDGAPDPAAVTRAAAVLIPLLRSVERWAECGRIHVEPLAEVRSRNQDPAIRHEAKLIVSALLAAGRGDEAAAIEAALSVL
jgi:hypothetical protein